MPTRAFDCPSTGQPCTNADCQVMHCETQRIAREQASSGLPPVRRRMLESAGWTIWNGGARPVHERDRVDVVWQSGDEIYNYASRLYWGADDRSDRVMAYRVREAYVPRVQTTTCDADGWYPWDAPSRESWDWDSGVCPVDQGQRVRIRDTAGNSSAGTAGGIRWWSSAIDVAAYQILDEHDQPIIPPHVSGAWVNWNHTMPPPDLPGDTIIEIAFNTDGMQPAGASRIVRYVNWDTDTSVRSYRVVVGELSPQERLTRLQGFTSGGFPREAQPDPLPPHSEAWVVGPQGCSFIPIDDQGGRQVLTITGVQPYHHELAQQLTALPMLLNNEMPGELADAIGRSLGYAAYQEQFAQWFGRHRAAHIQAEDDGGVPSPRPTPFSFAETDGEDDEGDVLEDEFTDCDLYNEDDTI